MHNTVRGVRSTKKLSDIAHSASSPPAKWGYSSSPGPLNRHVSLVLEEY